MIKKINYNKVRKSIRDVFEIGLGLINEKRNYTVAIFTDETMTSIADMFYEVGLKENIIPLIINVNTKKQEEIKTNHPSNFSAIIHHCDSIINLVSIKPECQPFRWQIVKEGLRVNKKVAHMPGITFDVLEKAAKINYPKLIEKTEELTNILTLAEELTIKTYEKYILNIKLGNWLNPPIASNGIIPFGGWGNIPSGEVFIEYFRKSKIEGDFVVDGSTPLGIIKKPIRISILNGKLNGLGPLESRQKDKLLPEILEALQPDTNPKLKMEEIGIGTNDLITPEQLTGNMLLDEKVLGTAHIALEKTGVEQRHMDMVAKYPEIIINKNISIMEDGKLLNKFEDILDDISNTKDDKGIKKVVRIKPDYRFIPVLNPLLFKSWKDHQGRLHTTQIGNTNTSRKLSEVYRLTKNKPLAISTLQKKINKEYKMKASDIRKCISLLKKHKFVNIIYEK